jgi:TPR repeat protein
MSGEGVLKDQKQATLWFRKAAEQGHDKAEEELGEAYAEGSGVTRDLQEAASWYRKAAAQGNKEAEHNLSLLQPANQ